MGKWSANYQPYSNMRNSSNANFHLENSMSQGPLSMLLGRKWKVRGLPLNSKRNCDQSNKHSLVVLDSPISYFCIQSFLIYYHNGQFYQQSSIFPLACSIINKLSCMVFFYISAPELMGSRQATLKQIKQLVIRKGVAQGRELPFDRSKFKMANLDTLMFSNDKVLKLEANVEGFLKKIDKQYCELEEKQTHDWYVRGGDRQISAKRYFAEFNWNKSKYPLTSAIPAIVELMEIKINSVETDLRKMTNTFNETKTLLTQNTQKQGNYNVKDLNDVIVEPLAREKDFIYTKFVTTLVCIVPAIAIEDFKRGYEMLSDNVIPYSARQLKIPQKDGLTIWTVNIFNVKLDEQHQHDIDHHDDPKNPKKEKKKYATPAAEFIDKAREKLKITVKEFKFESGLNDVRKKKREGLQGKLKAHKKTLSQICLTYFSQIYQLYIHVKMFRLVIESMMRFGSDKTVIYWIEPVPGKEKTIQTLLVQIFGDKQSEGLYGTKDEIEDGEDFFPFIYVPGITF